MPPLPTLLTLSAPPDAGAACPPQPPLAARPLMTPVEAGGLAAVFKVLANDTRLRLLHAVVRAGELSVNELAKALGLKPQAVSNQLQRLADLGVVAARRSGNHVHYRLVDGCVRGLLEQGWCLAATPPGTPPGGAE